MSAPTPIYCPSSFASALVAAPDTGDISVSDRIVLTDIYKGTYTTARANILIRGTYGSGSRLGWVVTSSRLDSERGRIGKLTINWEPGGPDADPSFLPLDDFDTQPVELYPKAERHPNFSSLPTGPITPRTISLAYQYARGASDQYRSGGLDQINGLPTYYGGALGTDQKDYALALALTLLRGEESYYLAGLKYQHVWHSFSLPPYTTTEPAPDDHLTRGGFVQNPRGPLVGGFPPNMQWLRLADAPQCIGANGSCYKITSTWIGAPDGHWDSIFYFGGSL